MPIATFKVPDGKLLKVTLELDEADLIELLTINGDFFVHPEDGIERLETALTGLPAVEDTLTEAIAAFVQTESIQLFGLNPAGVARAIMMCVEKKR